MSSTPLMAEFPQDKKEPIYPINETDIELVVGQPTQRRCFWSRFHCCHASQQQERPHNRFRRAIKFGLLTLLFLTATFFVARHHIRPHLPWKRHPVICVPVTDTTTTVELPLHSKFTRIGLHPSLTTGESHIVHSDDVKEGTVSVTFELPKDTDFVNDDDEPKVFACHIAGPKFVGLGVHVKGERHKEHDGERKMHKKDGEHHHHPHGPKIKALKTTIALPAAEAGHPRGISFHGPFGWFGHRRFGHGCMKKRVKAAIAKAIRVAKAEKEAKAQIAAEAQ